MTMLDPYNIFLHPELEPIEGKGGQLSGLNIAVKDNIAVRGWPLTAGSKILEGYISPYDATVITRLKQAGASFVGKTNLDEFAMGSSTENSAYGVTKNPWDESTVPGGSSGGSAAAVAADLCDVSLGSDTGGSIRQPAAFCGVTGLKPTYGAVSRYGLVALASSLDVIGPLARTAEAVEKVFSVISGKDEHDQTTRDYKYQPKEIDIATLKIGLPKELWQLKIDPEIKTAVESFVDWLKSRGAKILEVELPTLKLALPAYYIILPAEASANLARYDGIRYGASLRDRSLIKTYINTRALFGPEVKRRILLGTFVLSTGHYDEYYLTAERVREKITREHEQVFDPADKNKAVDLLISATTPTLPFKIGERTRDPIAMYQSDLLTVGASLAGIPALSLPVGVSKRGLPIGAQLMASWDNESLILSVAKQYQAATDWHWRKPKEQNG
jgi:aspartyl-tRNA(Asn)/glutamyl-tRNA(Gln) amidotransferase subunit A